MNRRTDPKAGTTRPPQPIREDHKSPAPEPSAAWRGIDTAPRDGTVIICSGTYPNGVPYVDTVFWSHEHWWGRSIDPPTHWMPLPPPPGVLGKDGGGEVPEPPWPIGPGNNAKRAGWAAFFAGKDRNKSPYPPARGDLTAAYTEGWYLAEAQSKAGTADPISRSGKTQGNQGPDGQRKSEGEP